MVKISSRVAKLSPFMIFEIAKSAAEIANREGGDFLSLEMGQPSTPATKAARAAMVAAIDDPRSHGYTRNAGMPKLCQSIADLYQRRYGIKVESDNVIVTVGSSTGFMMLALACFEVGDKVVMTKPGYKAYSNMLLAAGIEVELVDTYARDDWKLTPAHLENLGFKPDGVIIASPANPTGVVMNPSEIEAMARWCDDNGVRLISDEIYHGVTFGATTASVYSFSKTAVAIGSFSKYFSMTGHRIGWLVVPDALVDPLSRIAQNMVISVPTFSQIAAIAAINDKTSIAELDGHVERYRRNRDILLNGLDERLLRNVPVPEGGFYLYTDISAISNDSVALAMRLLEETRVATTPGLDFDPDEGHLKLRLSFAGDEQTIIDATKRISAWVADNA